MKKIFLALMAVAAITFTTSCGNKTQQGEAAADSTEVSANAGDEASSIIATLSEQLNAGDATKLQATLETVKAKVAELIKNNPEAAKQYVEQVQNFLKENADKVKAVVGDNAAANAAVTALTSVEPETIVNTIVQQTGDAAEAAKDAAVDAAAQQVDAAKDAAQQKVEDAKAAAKQKAEETKAAAKQKASEAVDNAAKDIKKGLGL